MIKQSSLQIIGMSYEFQFFMSFRSMHFNKQFLSKSVPPNKENLRSSVKGERREPKGKKTKGEREL